MEMSCTSLDLESTTTTPHTKAIIDLRYEDWLDCLEKTLENSIRTEMQDDKDVFIINPCPLTTITKLISDTVATNFRSLFEFDNYILASIGEAAASVLSQQSTTSRSNKEFEMHTETVNIIETYTRAAYMFGFSTFPDDLDPRMPISAWTNCAYTLQIIDQLLLFESKQLFGQFTVKQADLITNIVKQAAFYSILKNTEAIRKSCVRLLTSLLPRTSSEAKSIVELDMFHLLVSLCLSMPNLYDNQPKLNSVANGGLNDFNIFKLVLQAHCVQIFLFKIKLNTFKDSFEDDEAELEPASKKIYDFFINLLNNVHDNSTIKLSSQDREKLLKLSSKRVVQTLKYALMSFLRCSALFFSNLTNIIPSSNVSNSLENLDQEFESLLMFLGLSYNDFADLIDIQNSESNFKVLCDSWLKSIPNDYFQTKTIRVDYPLVADRFCKLPNDFVDLMSLSLTPQT